MLKVVHSPEEAQYRAWKIDGNDWYQERRENV